MAVDNVIPVHRCLECRRLVHPLDEYCEEHWQEYLQKLKVEAETSYPLTVDEIQSHIDFWSFFDPFCE